MAERKLIITVRNSILHTPPERDAEVLRKVIAELAGHAGDHVFLVGERASGELEVTAIEEAPDAG